MPIFKRAATGHRHPGPRTGTPAGVRGTLGGAGSSHTVDDIKIAVPVEKTATTRAKPAEENNEQKNNIS